MRETEGWLRDFSNAQASARPSKKGAITAVDLLLEPSGHASKVRSNGSQQATRKPPATRYIENRLGDLIVDKVTVALELNDDTPCRTRREKKKENGKFWR